MKHTGKIQNDFQMDFFVCIKNLTWLLISEMNGHCHANLNMMMMQIKPLVTNHNYLLKNMLKNKVFQDVISCFLNQKQSGFIIFKSNFTNSKTGQEEILAIGPIIEFS